MATDNIGTLTAGDTDYFLITLPGPGRLNVFTAGETRTKGKLFDLNGILLESHANYGNFIISKKLEAGSYCLAISGGASSTSGLYSLRVEGDFADDDHDSSCDNAEIITDPRGTTIVGNLSIYNDVDYFRINTPSSGHITTYTEGSTQTGGSLFDNNGIPLERVNNRNNFRISRELESGSYCLAVSGYRPTTNGIYSLRIEGDFADDDHGTDCGSATVIDKTSTAGDLSVDADADYFRIQIPESGGNLKVYTEGATDTKGVLYDNNGVFLVHSSYGGGSGSNFAINTELDAGTYCLEVSGEGRNPNGKYTLVKEGDKDTDGISDTEDNCPEISNADQLNTDSDSEGNACDLDDDNDQMPDTWELLYGLNPINVHDAASDKDGDGASNLAENTLQEQTQQHPRIHPKFYKNHL